MCICRTEDGYVHAHTFLSGVLFGIHLSWYNDHNQSSLKFQAAVSGLQNQPIINAVIDGDDIIYRDYIDISIAVGTPKVSSNYLNHVPISACRDTELALINNYYEVVVKHWIVFYLLLLFFVCFLLSLFLQGLVVPVIRNAEKMNFAEIEKEINTLAKKAVNGTISIDEMAGGSFTISNGGVYGSLLSTPIINPPQVRIF